MGLVALILALLIEQGRPLLPGNAIHRAVEALADMVARATDAGARHHGALGWGLVAAVVVGAVVALEWLAWLVHPVVAFCLHVGVLYATIGFRQFSHPFSEIQLALAAGDVAGARTTLERWMREDDREFSAAELPVSEICRLAIARALVASHRHVLAPLFWYLLLPGAAGPVAYRLAETLSRRWGDAASAYGGFAIEAYRWIDWLPTRMSASGFAIVGSFEDAVFAWRNAIAADAGGDQRALLLAAGGGALGLRIADPQTESGLAQASERAGDPPGADPGVDALQSAVGLVWRSVVLWVALYAMLTIASWLGR
ncbi:MAG: CobD/CbiB family protein [Burkholderiaceae bacterium]|nr:CobD/CbiB family protein [Burkholderiaceae bacterium]